MLRIQQRRKGCIYSLNVIIKNYGRVCQKENEHNKNLTRNYSKQIVSIEYRISFPYPENTLFTKWVIKINNVVNKDLQKTKS